MMNKNLKIIYTIDACFALLFVWFIFALPNKLFNTPTSYVIKASNGELLSAAIAKDGQWRFPLADSVPEKFVKCIVAFEDKRFHYHTGVDFIAFARAVHQNIRSNATVSGGSTLTMQVIRLSRKKKRSVWQKLIEMILAARLELTYSKHEIMAVYAANAPFGTNVVGLEAASWRYYGRDANKLSWGEMATLAVLPNAPSLVHPGKNARRLIRKRNDLLDKMVKLKIIDTETALLAKTEPIPEKPLPLPQNAPHLLNRFKDENDGNFTKLTSTLNFALQLKLNDVVKRYHSRYKANDINNMAILVLDIKKGSVVSYIGNVFQPENTEIESHVDMIRAKRSPGSTLKPLLYASMLNDGMLLPQTLIPDVPTQIAGYTPQNYDLGYDGAISADKALSRSLNIPAVKMLQRYKYERFYDKLKKLNISTLNQPADHYGLSLILGGSEVTMWDLANVYAGMARTLNSYNTYKGKYNSLDYAPSNFKYLKAKQKSENIEPNGILDHGSIWSTFNAMEEVMRPGDEGLWEQFSSSQRIAWKTGTSFGFRDAWAIGLNPDYVVCVWVGNADGEGRPGLIGIDVAAPVMFDVFRYLPVTRWFQTPTTKLIKLQVCLQSGHKASENCTTKIWQMVSPAGDKTSLCPYHKLIHLNSTGTFRVTDQCERTSRMVHQKWFILPTAMEYYYKVKNTDYKVLPPYQPGCNENGDGGGVMDLIYPKNNAMVYIPIEMDGTKGKIIFEAAHRISNVKIYWHVDQDFIGTTNTFHQIAVDAKPGKHVLTLVDEKGERLVQQFTVLAKDKQP